MVDALMGSAGELAALASARIGTTLRGKYRLERVLGIGGMAVVYAAVHRNRKQFAVKVLHPTLSRDHDTRTRFLREGYVANTVDHPGAVVVLDDDVAEDGGAFLVMELLDGETAEELWERSGRRLPLATVLGIADQLLEVLAAAHAKGIVHRDVKPANVFLAREGKVKVLDFGIARLRERPATPATGTRTAVTTTGQVMGTPVFIAPEQARGTVSEIDSRTDLWAVGALMYTLASGRVVHEADTAIQALIKAATRPAPSLRDAVPEAPSQVVHVVDRALSFDRAARWPTAEAMRLAIADAREALDAGMARPRHAIPRPSAFAPTVSASAAAVATYEDEAGMDRTPLDGLVPSSGDAATRLQAASCLKLGDEDMPWSDQPTRLNDVPAAEDSSDQPNLAVWPTPFWRNKVPAVEDSSNQPTPRRETSEMRTRVAPLRKPPSRALPKPTSGPATRIPGAVRDRSRLTSTISTLLSAKMPTSTRQVVGLWMALGGVVLLFALTIRMAIGLFSDGDSGKPADETAITAAAAPSPSSSAPAAPPETAAPTSAEISPLAAAIAAGADEEEPAPKPTVSASSGPPASDTHAKGTPASSTPKSNCAPPYTTDPRGKKHWKLECL